MILSWLPLSLGIILLSLAQAAARSVQNEFTIDLSSPLKSVSFQRTTARREPSVDAPAVHYQAIKPLKGRSAGRSAASALRAASSRSPPSAYQNISAILNQSTQYALQVVWDDEPLWLLFDTGSSDTWAVQSSYSCVSQLGTARTTCAWGPDFIDHFRYGQDQELHFKVTFGSGETVSGPLGRSDISVAGITVQRQLCGLANTTNWWGNNVTNGLVGLAYPALTSAYAGRIGDEKTTDELKYQPFFTSMVSQGLIDPYFAVAIEKGSSAGMIGWGGLPPVQWLGSARAYTDILVANVADSDEPFSYQYSFYTIVVDGIQYGERTDLTKYLYIVDTGTTLMHLPPDLAEAIAHSFEPRGTYIFTYGGYFAPCDAVASRIAVIIAGTRFWINPADLIYRDFKDPTTGMCMLGITSGGSGPYILGSVFLQNVLAVFDVGAAQMRFYSRY
ncbi:hypothetical protein jhhlp_000415 [Lomentospora prolificans]|uniref:Peptidase A1 domain-containing protein n=1 Tax=Lomentospora prolificans TaxID=41688 RepID=A0A2N3NKW3_9PEZI|nr:hypothetical protein jhhlp_000415 [Lomentospora prolificans]